MIIRLLFQTVLIALAQIWANKIRAVLTTLGIVIGVAAVVSIVAATKGLESFVLDQFATIGANKVWVFPRMPDNRRDRYGWRPAPPHHPPGRRHARRLALARPPLAGHELHRQRSGRR